MTLQALNVGNYLWRPVDARDRTLLSQWIEHDRDHAGEVTADFYCSQSESHESYAVEDRSGLVVFYIRLNLPTGARRMRLNMQFRPYDRFKRRKWTMDALIDGFEWMKEAAAGVGLEGIDFDSKKPELVAFAVRRLGFAVSERGYSYTVTPVGDLAA